MQIKTMLLSEFGIDEKYLAHTPDETLIAHSNLTLEYFHKIVNAKNLDTIIINLSKKIDSKNFELLNEMFINTIYLHDIGKKNPYFQAKKMNNIHFKEFSKESNSSNHSFYSSQKFIGYYKGKIGVISDRKIKEKFYFLLYSFSYHQAKHHGSLGEFERYCEGDISWTYLEKFNIPPFEFYILNKLLFSLLVSSDYYATSNYITKSSIDDFGLFSKEKKTNLIKKFKKFKDEFTKPAGINLIREEIFQEVETNLIKNFDKNIFYLEAPTGSGKTITSINIALKMLNNDENINKLFYVFPLNTLVEQTKNVFDEIFKDELDIKIINSITPLDIANQEDEETKYKNAYINRLFFHSPSIIMTHVSLFNILFGTSKEDNFPLWQLANSVIILDEIQSYNNHLWWYMVEFFDKYASLLNIKIIIMSATLPKLDYFLEKKDNFVDLISRKKRDYFFENNFFKDRVSVDFSYLDKKIDYEGLAKILDSKVNIYQKFLFEFIKKQSAREFYNLIKEKYKNIYELSGDDNKAYRQFVINKSKENNFIIIIATQVIEAGLDIDMDVGFKDISILDSEEQFMGRVNRSCKKNNSKVYFFDMDDAAKIYREDARLDFNLNKEKYRNILKNKEFKKYYEDVLMALQAKGLSYSDGLQTNYDNFKELLKKLNYKEIAKIMKPINSQNFSLYFPFKIDILKYKGVKEFIDLDDYYITDSKLDGQKVWNKFKELNEIDNFTQREFEKSHINSLMQFFTFSISRFDKNQKLPYFSYEFNGYYFIQDYKEFIIDGKFDRAKYLAKKEDIFL